MTDPIEGVVEEIASELAPHNGIFIPKKVVASVITAIIIGGVGVPLYIAKELSNQGQKIIKIDGQIESTKELMLQMVKSQETRLSRLENRIYGSNP